MRVRWPVIVTSLLGTLAAGAVATGTLATVSVAQGAGSSKPPGWGAPTVGPAARIGADPMTGRSCPAVHLQYGPPGNGTSEARAAKHPLFRRILVPGITDNNNGGPHGALVALADFNHDGRTDILVMRTNQLLLYLNHGCWQFTRHPLTISGPGWGPNATSPPEDEGIGLGDFNNDGNFDIYITRSTLGNSLLMSQGRYDTFKDEAVQLGVTNRGAYSRGISIGDVNGDGHLDIAVGADEIGTPKFGTSYQRLYVYDPHTKKFDDVGGTSKAPGFGGAPNCNPAHDRDSPGIMLRDLSGSGRLDLLQGYHDDMNMTAWNAPCNTGERKFGIYTWRNVGGRGITRYKQIRPGSNGLGGVGQMRYDPSVQDYVTVSHGLGLPYEFGFDAFNTGRLDVLGVGPTDPDFHVNSDQIAGKFFANLGNLRFRDETHKVGLDALNWTYSQWGRFYDSPVNPDPLLNTYCDVFSNRKKECLSLGIAGIQQYGSSITWGDFNNDGCVDFVESDRHESDTDYGTLRNTLFMNNCHGHFHPVTTYTSGLDTNSETMEAADLTGNGLLDLVAGVQPSNTFPIDRQLLPADRSYTKVYMNTGALGGQTNHWLELQLSGAPQGRLVGSELYLYDAASRKLLGRRDLFTTDSYKEAHDLIAHWGLAHRDGVYVRVRLPINHWKKFRIPCINHRLTLDVKTGRLTGCSAPDITARDNGARVTVTVRQPADKTIAGSRLAIPTSGATVSVGRFHGTTDGDGRATLDLAGSRPGRYRVTVSVPGLKRRRLTIRVTA